MSGSNCCFLTCIQISQEAGEVIWYSYLLKNFSQFVVIHTVKGFGIVNKAERDVFLELSLFQMIQWMFERVNLLGRLIRSLGVLKERGVWKSQGGKNFVLSSSLRFPDPSLLEDP